MNNTETPLILLHPDQRVGTDMERWRKSGGGEALVRAAKDPAAVREEIRLSDLRGLGGSGFPVWRKWESAVSELPKPDKYLVVNGNEDEPGTFKDRLLLEETPHQVIEGAVISALAIGANRIVFYINPDIKRSLAAMRIALELWQDVRSADNSPRPRSASRCSLSFVRDPGITSAAKKQPRWNGSREAFLSRAASRLSRRSLGYTAIRR